MVPPILNFIAPAALWLLLCGVPLVALALIGPRRLAARRFWLSLGLRLALLAALVLALAGAQLVSPSQRLTTIFLLDGSDSVALSQRARAEGYIQQALAGLAADQQAGVIVFGERALVERTPAGERSLGQVASVPGGARTDIASALQLGMSLLPPDGYRRLVLLSDGGENSGDALAAARLAAARGIAVDSVGLSGQADGLDVQLGGVELPATVRAGQQLRMLLVVESSAPASGRLVVQGPAGVLIDQPVQVQAGSQTLEVLLPAPAPAFSRYLARVEVEGDARPENNLAEAYTYASGRPVVLLVEGSPGAASNLAGALRAAQLEAMTLPPAAMPASLADLSAYDAVVLVDVARRAVSERAQSALGAYVHDLGRGLLMVGGPQSFGAGGWRETPVEAVLPVTMDIPSQLQLPAVSIVVVIDVSGSMAEKEHGQTKIELAARGAQQIAALLRDEDELTVIPFDTSSGEIIGPIPGSRRDEAINALSRIRPGGGGINIRDSLIAANKYAQYSGKPIKHIITISDGNDTDQQEGALEFIQQLQEQRVTVTSLAIGGGKDTAFLERAAQLGGGRYFLTDRAANIPAILTEEAQAVLRPYIIEETFRPLRGLPHPILRSIAQTPELYGYVVTTPKQTAQVLLSSPRGEPVLAAWQHGLGRALAWTSDFRGQWGRDWVQADSFPQLAAQLVAWLLPQLGPQNLAVRTTASGAELLINVQAQDVAGQPEAGLALAGRLLSGDGSGVDVTLREVAPGEYRAVVRGARPGAYLLQVVANDASGAAFGAATAGVLVPQSLEYRSRGANPGLLAAIADTTGGRLNPAPEALFLAAGPHAGSVRDISQPLLWLALLLLPLDVAVRRLRLGGQRPTTNDQRPYRRNILRLDNKRAEPNQRQPPQAADLERLRAAQEQARRRARGDE